jgi:hypothetical protein
MTLSKSSPRAKQRWVLLGITISVLLVVGVQASLALTGSTFDATDANLILDDEAEDWVNATNRQAGFDLPTGQTDNSFVQGTKEDTAVPVVEFGSIPNNKSDLLRFYVANEKAAGDEFLYLAWERVQEPNGTTNMDFEFNQSTTLSSNGVTPVRTAGDVLIKYDLSQGGVNPVLGYHLWVASGACEANGAKPPCWDPVHSLAGNFEGAVNTVVVTDPIPPNNPRDLSVRTFGEAAINLTDSGILAAGSCQGFGRAYLKSRSSDSFTAALKDFIAPIPVNINNCGSITIVKDVNPEPDGSDFAFTSAGLSNFSLDDDADATLSNTKVYSNQDAGSYTVTESVTTGYDLIDITCSGDDNQVIGTDSDADFTAGDTAVTIDLDAGENVTCTYTNEKDASITIIKDVNPEPDGTDFAFTGLAGFSLDDDAEATLSNTKSALDQNPGTYVIGESTNANYTLKTISCSGDDNQVIGTDSDADFTAGDTSVTIDLDPGENVTCTFTNEPKHVVIVIVCHQGTNTLAPSSVTDGTTATTSLAPGALPAGVTEAQLCGLGGARYAGLGHATLDLDVTVGDGPH